MKKAYLFPGQGSQFTGMGQNHYRFNPVFGRFCDKASEILEFDLTSVMFDGPEEELKQTKNTQPAIFLHSVALFESLKQQPDMTAGHSLGEFTALVAAKALNFEDALRIVRKRGELMQQAGEEKPGTMAAVIGMDDGDVEEICKKAAEETGEDVVPANYNATGQLVISGSETAVDKAVELLKEQGCKMAKKLPVSGAFHSPLMQSARDGLKEELDNVEIRNAECPVYANVTAEPTTDPETIRHNLLEQLLNPVKWTQSLQAMNKDGADFYIEVGPGKVLQGLVKRTLGNEVEIMGYQ